MSFLQVGAGVVEYEDAFIQGVPSGYVPAVPSGGVQLPNPATTEPALAPVATIYEDTIFSSSFTLLDFVEMFVSYAFIVAGALSAVFIFFGGISFILSSGNDEKIKQAVNTIRYSIIGLLVTILSFFFVTVLGRMFGLNFISYLSPAKIKMHIERVISSGAPDSRVDFEIRP